ncbi:MAG: hypothetical protein JWQ02_1033 [Capsulimonas sp.]|nr:hypothetical protein [Capsulimonas sp.]
MAKDTAGGRVVVSLDLPNTLHEQLLTIKAETGLTLAALTRLALRELVVSHGRTEAEIAGNRK